jgi:diguanylate cyclase (GGDEF)-like protein
MPGGLVLAAALVVLDNSHTAPWIHQANRTLPYVILVIGFLIGLRFHRSRLAFTVLIVILADRALHYFGPGGAITSDHETAILHAVALLLPLNMVLLCIARERGMLNFYGIVRLLFIAAQPLAIYILLSKNASLFKYLDLQLISLPYIDKYGIPDVLLLVNGVTLLFFLTYALVSNKAIIRGFFWALLSSVIALYEIGSGTGTTIFFSIAGIIVILSLLETAYIMAYHDELTGLPARRSLNTVLHTLGRRYTIAMLDIDFFKKFNDKYGHDVGDQVLCMVASHINKVGGGGKPFRYGGEEFTVIFPGKSKLQARPYLEKLRTSIAQAKFKLRGKKRPKKTPKTKRKSTNPKSVSVTISIGSAEPVSSFSKPAEVLKSADKALYQAKKKGRNCTV